VSYTHLAPDCPHFGQVVWLFFQVCGLLAHVLQIFTVHPFPWWL